MYATLHGQEATANLLLGEETNLDAWDNEGDDEGVLMRL